MSGDACGRTTEEEGRGVWTHLLRLPWALHTAAAAVATRQRPTSVLASHHPNTAAALQLEDQLPGRAGWLFAKGAFDKGDLLHLRDEEERRRYEERELREKEALEFAQLRERAAAQTEAGGASGGKPAAAAPGPTQTTRCVMPSGAAWEEGATVCACRFRPSCLSYSGLPGSMQGRRAGSLRLDSLAATCPRLPAPAPLSARASPCTPSSSKKKALHVVAVKPAKSMPRSDDDRAVGPSPSSQAGAAGREEGDGGQGPSPKRTRRGGSDDAPGTAPTDKPDLGDLLGAYGSDAESD